MERRTFLGASAGVAAGGFAAPALSQGAVARTLRVIPQANLTSLDPVWTTAVVTRNNAFMIYDQICAQDAKGDEDDAGDVAAAVAEGEPHLAGLGCRRGRGGARRGCCGR